MNKNDFLAQYQSQWWMETSKRIKSRDHNTCQMCGCNDKPLSVHHLYYGGGGSIKVDDESLITLCEDCHRLQNLYREINNDMIQELKQRLTDAELYVLLYSALNDYTIQTDIPCWMASYPQSKILKTNDAVMDNYMSNLYTWRTSVYYNVIKHNSLWHYCVYKEKGNDTSEIERWFEKTYKQPIQDYIDNNKQEWQQIQNEVFEHLHK